ncbi:MAG: gldN [Bacteroidetes bacterium]|nr:gldN [Bacteroidota bacterium]
MLFLYGGLMYSQKDSGVGQPQKYYEFNIVDCFKNLKYKGSLKKDSMKPNAVMRGQRVWRTISLEDKENKEILNSNNMCVQISLFEVIKFGLLEKKLNAFTDDNFNEAAKNRLKESHLKKIMSVKDTSEVRSYDASGNEKTTITIENRYLQSNDIKTYVLKEDWFVSSYNGKIEKRIVAIAPLIFDKKLEKTRPLFWLYYNEWSELFNLFETKNFRDDKRISYAYAFQNQYFISKVSKDLEPGRRSFSTLTVLPFNHKGHFVAH